MLWQLIQASPLFVSDTDTEPSALYSAHSQPCAASGFDDFFMTTNFFKSPVRVLYIFFTTTASFANEPPQVVYHYP